MSWFDLFLVMLMILLGLVLIVGSTLIGCGTGLIQMC